MFRGRPRTGLLSPLPELKAITPKQIAISSGFDTGTQVIYRKIPGSIVKHNAGTIKAPKVVIELDTGIKVFPTIHELTREDSEPPPKGPTPQELLEEEELRLKERNSLTPQTMSLEESRRLAEAAGFTLLTGVESVNGDEEKIEGFIVGYSTGINGVPYLLVVTLAKMFLVLPFFGLRKSVNLSHTSFKQLKAKFPWTSIYFDHGLRPGSILMRDDGYPAYISWVIRSDHPNRNSEETYVCASLLNPRREFLLEADSPEWHLVKRSELCFLEISGADGILLTIRDDIFSLSKRLLPNLFKE